MGGMYNNEQSSMPADLSEICDMSPVTVISDMRSPVNLSDLTERELFEINLTRRCYPIIFHVPGSLHFVTSCINFYFNLKLGVIYHVHCKIHVCWFRL
jgi:hypothetical protein